MRSISVIGIGQTKFGRFPDHTLRDLIDEAGHAAIADAGIHKGRIQAAYVGNFNGGFLNNQNHIGPMVTEQLGLGNIPAIHTEGACASGSIAFRQGCMAIQAGIYDVVLVGGVEKMCHLPTETVTSGIASGMDYEQEAMFGLTFPACFAMIANRYFYEYRNVKREMAQCAVNAHKNAMRNPHAQMPKELTVEKVLSADLIADPLSLFDCSLTSDGATFLVLATTEIAQQLGGHRIVELVGAGHAGDNLTLHSKRSFTGFAAAQKAAAQAYAMANLAPGDIHLAEVHDCFTITQIINTEDLGFFAPGKGGDGVDAGHTALDGRIPINPSGGLKAKGHPIGATGVSQIYEIVTQLRGDAGTRQVRRADIGLTHNLGGTAATALIHIFKGR